MHPGTYPWNRNPKPKQKKRVGAKNPPKVKSCSNCIHKKVYETRDMISHPYCAKIPKGFKFGITKCRSYKRSDV